MKRNIFLITTLWLAFTGCSSLVFHFDSGVYDGDMTISVDSISVDVYTRSYLKEKSMWRVEFVGTLKNEDCDDTNFDKRNIKEINKDQSIFELDTNLVPRPECHEIDLHKIKRGSWIYLVVSDNHFSENLDRFALTAAADVTFNEMHKIYYKDRSKIVFRYQVAGRTKKAKYRMQPGGHENHIAGHICIPDPTRPGSCL